jgi:hypothetical protein
MRRTMFADAEQQLMFAQISPGDDYYKEGAVIIRELLEEGSISRQRFYGLVGREIAEKFLETHLFTSHFGSREITFQSTVMKRFYENN